MRPDRISVFPTLFIFFASFCFSTGATQSSQNVEFDIGPDFAVPGTNVVIHKSPIVTSGAPGVSSNVFSTSREGKSFQISVNLPAGTYDVDLGFVETTICQARARLFHVMINDLIKLESYDIFSAAGGCGRAQIETFSRQTISALDTRPLTIQFNAVASQAAVAYVHVRPSKKPCIPVSKEARTLATHLAHAVPGSYPQDGGSYVDRLNKGYVRVFLNGKDSHTHFSYPGGAGQIISYEWSLTETGKVLSRQAVFGYNFPLGATRVLLSVTDNSCAQDEAETTVTVTGNNQPGAYCYYYRPHPVLPTVGSLTKYQHPVFAAISQTGKMNFPKFPYFNKDFIMRCQLFVNSPNSSGGARFSLQTSGSGVATLYKGEDIIVDSDTAETSVPLTLASGLNAFEIIYRRTNIKRPPSLSFHIDGALARRISHDQSTVLPIVTAVDPPMSSLTGGSSLRISGFGLYWPLKVRFGNIVTYAKRRDGTATNAIVAPPVVKAASKVQLSVESLSGFRSNAVPFTFTGSCANAAFDEHELVSGSGEPLTLRQPTSVAMGPDGDLYIGTRGGRVERVTYNAETLVSSVCHSETLIDSRYKQKDGSLSPRSILGITFDPRDSVPRPYVSVSTLDWLHAGAIDQKNPLAWSNGAVERLKPSTAAGRQRDSGQCLQHDKMIVRNLPVSVRDHAINELVFTQNGDLLVAVGGNTNSGLPAKGLGGMWETYFSASVVIARLSRGAKYNGVIPYLYPMNPQIAVPQNGYSDVDIYASGVRNLFSMAMSRSGRIYAIDMGPNCNYGNVSSTCSEYSKANASRTLFVSSFPGRVKVDRDGDPSCRYGPKRIDKLLEIRPGKFYGHPNLQRAVTLKRRGECAWVDPNDNAIPGGHKAPSNYMPPLSMVYSAKTGVREYGANLFCGQMRGDLIMAQVSQQKSWRVQINADGKLRGNEFSFLQKSGIRAEENIHGDLLFPRYFDGKIYVSRPKVGAEGGFSIVNALPFRHGRRGGTKLMVGGWGFQQGVKVFVGGKVCPVTLVSAKEITCTVPALSGSSQLVPVSVNMDGEKNTLDAAVLYMSV